jgi:hypothetical protein
MNHHRPSLSNRDIARFLTTVALTAVLITIICIAQVRRAYAEPCNIPQFNDYTDADPSFQGYQYPEGCPGCASALEPTGKVDLSDPIAYQYRTRLREAARLPPNFDVVYRVVTWGCGTSCASGVIIDERNGRVTWLPRAEFNNVIYMIDSTLIMLQLSVGDDDPSHNTTSFWYLEGGSFKQVRAGEHKHD